MQHALNLTYPPGWRAAWLYSACPPVVYLVPGNWYPVLQAG